MAKSVIKLVKELSFDSRWVVSNRLNIAFGQILLFSCRNIYD